MLHEVFNEGLRMSENKKGRRVIDLCWKGSNFAGLIEHVLGMYNVSIFKLIF